MHEVIHIFKHSVEDTFKLFPLLFFVYFLIELMESKNVFKFEKSKLLNGKASPAIGALFGSVPQCGFSVISSELYSKRKISIAALISVFIATSDEAVPLMLSNYKSIPALLVLIFTKIILAILIGYLTMGLHKVFFKNTQPTNTIKSISLSANNIETHTHTEDDHHHSDHNHDNHHSNDDHNHIDEHNHSNDENQSQSHDDQDEDEPSTHKHVHACCNHDFEHNKFNWKHPLIHSIKITLYIFIINLIMNSVIEFLGEDKLTSFLSSSNSIQPILAFLIGMIPNCASSVVLTELYLMGGLSFGSIIAGLSVNAGLGIFVLFKENKNKKENLFIILMLIIPSLIFGYLLHYLPLSFLQFK